MRVPFRLCLCFWRQSLSRPVIVPFSELGLKENYTNSCLLLSLTDDVSWRKRKVEGNVFRLLLHTKTFLTELALIKGAALVCEKFLSKKPSSTMTAGLSSVHYMAVFLSAYSAPHQNSFVSKFLLVIGCTRFLFEKQYHSTKHSNWCSVCLKEFFPALYFW